MERLTFAVLEQEGGFLTDLICWTTHYSKEAAHWKTNNFIRYPKTHLKKSRLDSRTK